MSPERGFPFPGDLVTITLEGLTNPRTNVQTEPFNITSYDYQGNMIEFGLIGGVTMTELADMQFYVWPKSWINGDKTTYNVTYFIEEPLLAGDKATVVFPKEIEVPQTLRELNAKSLNGHKDIIYSVKD